MSLKFKKITKGEYKILINNIAVATVVKLESASNPYWFIELNEEGEKIANVPSCSPMQLGGWASWGVSKNSAVWSKFENVLSI